MRVIAFFLGCVSGYGLFWAITTEYVMGGGLIMLTLAGLLGFIIYDAQNKDE